MLRVGSLFSGIGGFDLAFEWAGARIAWQVEIDPFCQAVLRKHWPDVEQFPDVHAVGRLPRRHVPSDVDILCGGFPCQPVSTSGKQLAQADQRWLWPEVDRLVRELRPGVVVLENVAGLLIRGLGDVLGDLAAAGYDAEWTSLRAADVGSPQERERVFVIAWPMANADSERRQLPTSWRLPAVEVPIGAAVGFLRDSAVAHCWPNAPGAPAFGWEPQRVLRRRESGVGVHADGLSAGLVRHRRRAINALGNAIVPQVAYPVAVRAIQRLKGAIA